MFVQVMHIFYKIIESALEQYKSHLDAVYILIVCAVDLILYAIFLPTRILHKLAILFIIVLKRIKTCDCIKLD